MQPYALSDYVMRETRWSADCEKPAFPRAAIIAFHARTIFLRRDCTVLPIAFAHKHATKNSFTYWGSFEGRNLSFWRTMHLVHHNFKAACLLTFYFSWCRMAPCKSVSLRSYGVFAHDVLILYPLQFNWFSVFVFLQSLCNLWDIRKGK